MVFWNISMRCGREESVKPAAARTFVPCRWRSRFCEDLVRPITPKVHTSLTFADAGISDRQILRRRADGKPIGEVARDLRNGWVRMWGETWHGVRRWIMSFSNRRI